MGNAAHSIKAGKAHAIGYWTDKHAFVKACESSHHAGHKGHEAYTPWPIHGLEAKMGLRRSWIGRPVLFMLLFGALCGYLMQYYMMKVDYPINIAGKNYNSWPAFVVITFESGILCGALTTFLITLLVACKLFPAKTQLPSDLLTDDTFCLTVPAADAAQLEALESWMKEHGADSTTRIEPAANVTEGEPAHA